MLFKHFLKLFILLSLTVIALAHYFDLRTFNCDIDVILNKSLDLVDLGKIPTRGDVVFNHFQLGPLKAFLMVLPLLLTRSPFAQYWFVSLQAILACLLFYYAHKSLGKKDSLFIWTGTISFASIVLFRHIPIDPTGERILYLPLALYYFFLVKSIKSSSFIVFTWLAIAICLQVHLSAIMLIPCTIVATCSIKKPVSLAYTFAGAFLVAIISYPLNIQLIESVTQISSGELFSLPLFGFTFFKNMLIAIVGYPLSTGLATGIFGMLGLIFCKKIVQTFPEYLLVVRAGLVGWLGIALFFPWAWQLKQRPQFDHLSYFSIFAALFVSLFFKWYFQKPILRPSKKFVLNLFKISILLTLAGSLIWTSNITGDSSRYRLKNHILIADNCGQIIQDESLHSVGIKFFALQKNSSKTAPLELNSQRNLSLIRLKYPELQSYFSPNPEHELLCLFGNDLSMQNFTREKGYNLRFVKRITLADQTEASFFLQSP